MFLERFFNLSRKKGCEKKSQPCEEWYAVRDGRCPPPLIPESIVFEQLCPGGNCMGIAKRSLGQYSRYQDPVTCTLACHEHPGASGGIPAAEGLGAEIQFSVFLLAALLTCFWRRACAFAILSRKKGCEKKSRSAHFFSQPFLHVF